MRKHVTLYHFTTMDSAYKIIASGMIKPGYSLLKPLGPRAIQLYSGPANAAHPYDSAVKWTEEEIQDEFGGPLVVHLTRESRDCTSIETEKNEARFEVRLRARDADPWGAWIRKNGVDPARLQRLSERHADAGEYFVVPRPIPKKEWREVVSKEGFDTMWP